MMKKTPLILLLSFLCLLMAVSCDVDSRRNNDGEENVDDTPLRVISNIGESGTRELEDVSVSEVLLRFHSEGLYEGGSSFTLDDPYAFYVDYIGENEKNHTDYGMYFNTVLYVPDVIRTVYDAMGGKDPDSGNPFWWYMDTFLGKDLNEIRSSWKTCIDELLSEEGKELPYPKSGNEEDEKWRKRSSFIQYSPYNFDSSSTPVTKPAYEYVYVEGHWDGMLLFLPSSLVRSYLERGGDYINNTEAFYWYMDRYKGVGRDEIDRMVENGGLSSYLKDLDYTAPVKGDGVTVDENCYTIVSTSISNQSSGEGKILSAVYTYGDVNNLQFRDGRTVSDRERLYFVDSGYNSFIAFVPESFCTRLKEVTGYEWDGASADLFFALLSSFGLTEGEDDGYRNYDGKGTLITREYIEENVVNKSIDDIQNRFS